MAKRGPKPKDRAPARPSKALRKPPAYLDAEARKHWTSLAKLLNEAGHASALDEDALAAYCSIWSRWREAERKLAEPPSPDRGGDGGGVVVVANNGFRQLSPWYAVSRECRREMKSYLAEFGLSPRARAKLALPETEQVDEKWSDFD